MSNESIELPPEEDMGTIESTRLIPRPATLQIRETLKKQADEEIKKMKSIIAQEKDVVAQEESIKNYLKTHKTKK